METKTFVRSGLGNWETDWIPVGAAGYRDVSLTVSWAAAGSTAGTLSVVGSDDPDVEVPLTLDKTHGSALTTTSSAGATLISLSGCPALIKVKYARSGGGAADQFTVAATVL